MPDWSPLDLAGTGVVAAVVVHLALTLGHAGTHLAIPVPITWWQAVYASVVLVVAPVVGVGLLAGGRRRVGAGLVLVAGIAGLTFEGVAHFVVANPDHVGSVDHGTHVFGATALLTTGSDAVIALAAGAFLLTAGPAGETCRES